jgi:hypothetical protein
MTEPEIRMIKIRHKGGASETVAAEQVGNEMYILLESSTLACSINIGTTVEVKADVNGELELTKVVRASDYKTRRFLLPKLTKAELIEQLGNPITEAGGLWEVDFVGMILIHMPQDSSFDLHTLFHNLGSTEVIDSKQSSV